MRNDQEQRNSQGIFSSPKTVKSGSVAHPDSSVGIGFFLGVKQTKSGLDHPPPSSIGVTTEQTYSPSVLLLHVIARTSLLPA